MPENEEMEQDDSKEQEETRKESSTLREIEKDEDGLEQAKKPNKILIAVLSVVIFLALFIFFKGEETPHEDASTQAPAPETEVNKEGAQPNAGEILIADGEKLTSPENTGEKTENVPIVPIPKEELNFFDPLEDTESKRPVSEAEEMSLLKPETEKPSPEKQKPVKEKVSKPSSTAGPFTIQLGAFKDKKSADKLDEQLRNKGYDSFVLAVRNDLYRVRVGSYNNKQEAQVVVARMKKTDQLNPFVTTE